MTPASLATFFAQMQDLLAGVRSAAEVERVLGPSASGTARLALYTTLVDRQQRDALGAMFRPALVAADSWNRVRAQELRTGYLRAHPPSHWSPSVVAVGFADYLQSQDVPPDVVELADYVRTRFEVLRAPDAGLRHLQVRHYTHDIPTFVQAVERDGGTTGRPTALPTTLILGRQCDSAEWVVLTANLPLLTVLHLGQEGAWPDGVPRELVGEVRQGLAVLTSHGVITTLDHAAVEPLLA